MNRIPTEYIQLSELITIHSTKIKEGENVVLDCIDIPEEMIISLIKSVNKQGGNCILWNKSWSIIRTFLQDSNVKQITNIAKNELEILKNAQVYISLRASYGHTELGGLTSDQKSLFHEKWIGPVHYNYRVHNTRWCSVKWPTDYMAQELNINYEDLKNLFFEIILKTDYKKLSQSMKTLKKMLESASKIQVKTRKTDILFTKNSIPVLNFIGEQNLPDGEIATAPEIYSANGKIYFDIPSNYQGSRFSFIELTIRNGKVIEYATDKKNMEELKRILCIDKGAQYLGEFAFGANREIEAPFGDTMFDEKIAGTIHFALGNSYKSAFNGNISNIHWDLVLDMRKGGEIYFDNVLIQKNGKFISRELSYLNPK